MNDNYIVAVYVIVAAKHFQNHHEQTVPLMVRLGYIRSISLSRFNCCLLGGMS